MLQSTIDPFYYIIGFCKYFNRPFKVVYVSKCSHFGCCVEVWCAERYYVEVWYVERCCAERRCAERC
jgi:hypothetical protein